MNNKWIIALVLLLAVVVVFAACKGNEKEETPSQTPTQSTTEPVTDDELEILPGDDIVVSDDDFKGENVIVIGGDSSGNTGEDTISWDEIVGKKS